LFSLPHTLKLTPAFVIRIMLAAGLALALLAGVIPFNTFSSAQQTCTMSCCVGKPPHMAGSCSAAFSDADHAETDGVSGASEHQSHDGSMQMDGAGPEIIEATSHCGTKENSSEKKASSRRSSPQATSIIAHALTTPCSPECAAAAVPNFSQVRRPRPDSAALKPASSRPRPPTLVSIVEQTASLQTSPTVFCRQSRPRPPPSFLNHLPA
jgi:hypothetical protein